ncbi:MAG: AAA family ATPase [Candidatus Hodarchaeota archaeon]
MAIKSIEIVNFRSFEKLNVSLENFNVLIGPNASGKSNFIQIFQFLRDITNHGLGNAISIQGDVEYITNVNIGASKPLSMKVVTDEKIGFGVKKDKIHYGLKSDEILYDFAIKFDEHGRSFEITRDRIELKCGVFQLERVEKKRREFREKARISNARITIANNKGKLDYKLSPRDLPLELTDIFPPFFRDILPKGTLMMEVPVFTFVTPVESMFTEIPIYDFDPKLPKKAVPFTAKSDLEEDGSNLAIVLKRILEDEKRKRKLLNLMNDFLPFVKNLRVEQFAGRYLIFTVCESYSEQSYLPASLMSDGTINITSLIVALYFEEDTFVIVEEPERNIHPYLISRLVSMFKETSEEKQIIVTTHNPEIVKYADINDLLFISRDCDGFSCIERPFDKKEVKVFLENEIGIDELFVQNLLAS